MQAEILMMAERTGGGYPEGDGADMGGGDWAQAACRSSSGTLAGLFFSEQVADIARAKSICAGCVLRNPCFEAARDRREPYGVWGGRLFFKGKVLAIKRPRGRPPKVVHADPVSALSA